MHAFYVVFIGSWATWLGSHIYAGSNADSPQMYNAVAIDCQEHWQNSFAFSPVKSTNTVNEMVDEKFIADSEPVKTAETLQASDNTLISNKNEVVMFGKTWKLGVAGGSRLASDAMLFLVESDKADPNEHANRSAIILGNVPTTFLHDSVPQRIDIRMAVTTYADDRSYQIQVQYRRNSENILLKFNVMRKP